MANSNLNETSSISTEASRKLSDLLLRSSRDIVWIQAVKDGELLYVSPMAEDVLGISTEGLRSEAPFMVSLIHEDDKEELLQARERVLSGQTEVLEKSYRIIRPDGQQRWLYERGTIARDEAKASEQYVGIATDTTGGSQSEIQLIKHVMDLEQVFRVSALREMASGIAHELNQPLAAIAHYADAGVNTLSKPKPSVERLNSLYGKLMEQSLHAGRIVHRIRNLANHNPFRLTVENISDIFRKIVDLFGSDLKLNSIRVESDFGEVPPLVLVDRLQIEQVILNLMRNSIEALQETQISQREITLSANIIDEMVEIAISDNGRGTEGEEIDKFFDAFLSTKKNALGMGLAISRSIIEKHGGRLWGTTNSDCGLTMHFTLCFGGKVHADNSE